MSRRGLLRALVRLSLVPVVAVGLYLGLTRAAGFHNPLFVVTEGDIELARGNEPAVARVRGSWTLEGATDDEGFVSLLKDIGWDAVVLQERSWYLAESRDWWMRQTYPYACRSEMPGTPYGSYGLISISGAGTGVTQIGQAPIWPPACSTRS